MKKKRINIYICDSQGQLLFEGDFDRFPINLGSQKSADIVLEKPGIQQNHLLFSAQEGEVYVLSLSSESKIILNGNQYTSLPLDKEKKFKISSYNFHIKVETVEATLNTINAEDTTQSYTPTLTNVQTVNNERLNSIVEKNKGFTSLKNFQNLNKVENVPKERRVVHGFVTWHDEIIDSRLFFTGEAITIGPEDNGLYLPFFKQQEIVGLLDKGVARISIPYGVGGHVDKRSESMQTDLYKLMERGQLKRKGRHNLIKIKPNEVLEIDFNNHVSLFFFIDEEPEKVFERFINTPGQFIRESLKISSVIHGVFLMLAIVISFRTPKPKIKNIPDRVAKLLVQKPEPPKPLPEPKPEPKPEPVKPTKEVVRIEPKPVQKKKPIVEKKIQRKPKKIVVKKLKTISEVVSHKVSKINEKNIPRADDNAKDLNRIGALAALSALNINAPMVTSKPVSININHKAGGGPSNVLKTTGMISAIKAQGGRQIAENPSSVKTMGKGFGTGEGFGVAGLQGEAGNRGSVRGVVVGTPELMKVDKNEGLNQGQVMEVVKKNISYIQRCYERALLKESNISGRVEYEWFISPQGGVKWAKVKSSDVKNGSDLNTCVVNVIKKMKFPVAKNGETTQPSIGFPFGRM